jgi:hypothetical protein
MDVITTDTTVLRGQRRLRAYRWQTKGWLVAMAICARYYLPEPRKWRPMKTSCSAR